MYIIDIDIKTENKGKPPAWLGPTVKKWPELLNQNRSCLFIYVLSFLCVRLFLDFFFFNSTTGIILKNKLFAYFALIPYEASQAPLEVFNG